MIICDGEGCTATAYLPIALRSVLLKGGERDEKAPTDWLFIRHKDSWLHYCPACSRKSMRVLARPEPGDVPLSASEKRTS